jgi:hypothetical protein
MLLELPDIVQIKFEGGGVSPDEIRLSELSRLLKQIEDYFIQQIRSKHPETPREDIQLALNAVRRSSAAFGFVSSMPDETLTAFHQFGDALSSNNYIGLVPSSKDLAKTLVGFTRRHHCHARLTDGRGDYAVVVTPETRVGGAQVIRGETQFYGVLERIGGAEPRFSLRISESETLRGEISQALAIELASHLYSWVGITGVAQWNPITGDVEEFQATGTLAYRGTGIASAVALLKGAIGDQWSEDEEDERDAMTLKLKSGDFP